MINACAPEHKQYTDKNDYDLKDINNLFKTTVNSFLDIIEKRVKFRKVSLERGEFKGKVNPNRNALRGNIHYTVISKCLQTYSHYLIAKLVHY